MASRPIRIAGASGSASDRRQAIAAFASAYPSDPVDVIVGDWMSETHANLLGEHLTTCSILTLFFRRS